MYKRVNPKEIVSPDTWSWTWNQILILWSTGMLSFMKESFSHVFKMRTLHVWRFQSNYILKLKEVCLCSLLNIWFKSKPMSVLVYILTIECYIGKCKKTSCECEAKQKNRNKRSLFIPYFKMKSNVCQEIVLRYFPVNQHLSLFPLCNHCLTNMEYICKTRQSLQFFFLSNDFFLSNYTKLV